MPVARYFLFVGGAAACAAVRARCFCPAAMAVASNAAPSINKTVVRIRSDQKLPERVVYDTSLPTIVPPAATASCRGCRLAPAADVSAQARVRDTFAQFVAGRSEEA